MNMAIKRSLKRKTDSLLTIAQNNAIRTKYIKAKMDNTQQNSKFSPFDKKDKAINQVITNAEGVEN